MSPGEVALFILWDIENRTRAISILSMSKVHNSSTTMRNIHIHTYNS
jgi:hypothetical protein